jgi:hypothetical protein
MTLPEGFSSFRTSPGHRVRLAGSAIRLRLALDGRSLRRSGLALTGGLVTRATGL